MPTEFDLARARRAMDEAREELNSFNQAIEDERVAKAKAFRAAEKAYKELCAEMEEA